MQGHNLVKAEQAVGSTLGSIKDAFAGSGLTVKGVVVNVLYEEGGATWAVASSPPDVSVDDGDLLAKSLRTSAEEVVEK